MIFTNQKVCLCVASHKPSFLCKESPAEVILLVFVYKTASGIARSNTENGLHSWSAPHFYMGRDNVGDITRFVPGDLDKRKLNKE